VALSGDGGDELFGGYDQYGKLRRLLPLLALPQSLRSALAAVASGLPRGALRNGLRHLRSPDAAELAFSLMSGARTETLERLCGAAPPTPNPVYLAAFRDARVASVLQRSMIADARVYLPDDILTKVDRASMSVGLEARVPLLDYRVVGFAFGLSPALLRHGGRSKAPLRALAYRHVPPALLERPKQGFAIPIHALLGRELAEWRARYLAPERLREEGNLAPEGVARLLAEAHERGGPGEETAMLWRLLCFQRWLARHHGDEREGSG
jgi:asparagine synthase (glutamine-hydrolysing)